jgi:hypothetical protein
MNIINIIREEDEPSLKPRKIEEVKLSFTTKNKAYKAESDNFTAELKDKKFLMPNSHSNPKTHHHSSSNFGKMNSHATSDCNVALRKRRGVANLASKLYFPNYLFLELKKNSTNSSCFSGCSPKKQGYTWA